MLDVQNYNLGTNDVPQLDVILSHNRDEILNNSIDHSLLKDTLRQLWADILQDDPTSFTDQDVFFEVGGDSISAQRLIVAAEEHGILLTIEKLFMNSSLEEMTEVAEIMGYREEDKSNGYTSGPSPFELLDRSGPPLQDTLEAIAAQFNVPVDRIDNAYPCSSMQESLVAEYDASSTNLYVRQFVFRLADDLAIDKFQRAWQDTIHANPVLRSRVYRLEEQLGYVQAVVNEDALWSIVATDLTGFLGQDATLHMYPGGPFFRYTIVTTDDAQSRSRRHFVWTVHHALCDGASIPEVLNEVALRFQGEVPPARVPFDKFIQSTTTPSDRVLEERQQFWLRLFSDRNPTSYPALPRTPGFQANPSATLQQTLRLDRLPSFGMTKALLLRAAFAILLSNHTGTEDVALGVINNGRTGGVPGVGRMTGPTINLVPVALRVDPKQSVASFLSEVRVQSAEMMPFEHSGVSNIRKYLADRPSTALDFQALLVVHPMEFADAMAPALEALGLTYADGLGKEEQHPYPLVFTCTLATQMTVSVTIQHDERVVSAEHAKNLIHQLQTVLTQLSDASHETVLESISPFSEHDLVQIREWNKSTPPTEETCIHDLFQRQVHMQPSAVAVHSLEQSLTYLEVDAYSSSLAVQLVDLGVRLGQYVAVCFEKSIWTVTAILAVFKAGAVYVPIEPAHPRARTAEVLQKAQVEVSFASQAGAEVLQGLCKEIVVVDGPPSPQAWNRTPPCSLPSSTAYLLFTSGSTGKPKGILMSHSGICTSIVHHGTAFGAGPHWRTLQFGSHTFDLSIGEFFTTLAFGGCICVPSEEDRVNSLAEVITALNANTLLVVPTVANLLLPDEVPTLTTIVLAGEPITQETITRWADHVELTAAYGPSETAVYCSGNLRVSADANPAHIGPAIGATMWIVNPDNYHELRAIGGVGEIVISGGLLGSGYFGDKDATDAAFVPAPGWMKQLDLDNPDRMLYRSGDLGRYNPDGTFHIVGRRDTQVKLRGFRIELGEIENQMMVTGLVAAALVALPAKGPCHGQIVTVMSFNKPGLDRSSESDIVLSPDRHSQHATSMLDRLRRRLSLMLPEYMVPIIWVLLDKMPLLISGKIDRKAIKLWVDGMDFDTFQHVIDQPQTDGGDAADILPGSLAETLRQLWSEVLRVPAEHIGLRTSFFAVGGDSIAAIGVVSKSKQLGLQVTVRGIISATTLENLVTLVEDSQASVPVDAEQSPAAPSSPSSDDWLRPYERILQARLRDHPSVAVDHAYAFSPFQREILRQRNANPAVFLLSWQMEIASRTSQPISLEKLVQAWKRVVQKFPILHSIFLADPTVHLSPVQVVLANAEPEIATAFVAEGRTEPTFETMGTPLVDDCFLPHRALFSQMGDRFYIHLELDHLTIDGWSLKLVKEALLDAYEANENYVSGEPPSYKHFVAAHQPSRIDEDGRYWASVLQNQSPALLSLPVGRHVTAPSPRKTILYLPSIPAPALTAFGVANGLTSAIVFDAAWAQTLSLYTGSPDVGFEYVVSGRDEDVPGVFDIVGPLINILPYHLQKVSTETSPLVLASLAHKMQDQRSQDGLHSSANIREVVDGLQAGKLFNTAVNFQRRPSAVTTESLWVDDNIEKSIDPWHFDVLVRVMHITDDNTLRPSVEFDARLFDAPQMKAVADHFWQRVQQTLEVLHS